MEINQPATFDDDSGYVIGPASSVNNDIVVFDGTTGKLIKDSGVLISSIPSQYWQRNSTTLSPLTAGDNISTSGGFIVVGGTSSQFLKADGSIDSSTYLTAVPAGYVTETGVETLTNKKITKRVDSSQTGVTTIAINSNSYDGVYATDTGVSGTLTISADTGSAQSELQSLAIEITSTNVQTLSWTSGAKGYYGGSTPLPVSTSGGGLTDYFTFVWSSTAGHWRLTGSAYGFN